MYIPRHLQLAPLLSNKSYFLFGPRQTGKTALIKEQLMNHKYYNLLDRGLYLRLNTDPTLIRKELTANDRIVIIDEIQKIPALLDEVHLMIEELGIHFLLTGSSARALKAQGVNLLGGRARQRLLHPFIQKELAEKFELIRALDRGLIPSIYFSDSYLEDLEAYCGQYLKEEIAGEAKVRNIGAFSRFLEVAGLCNSQMINYTQVGNDAQIPPSTIREYFQILYDTFLAYEVKAYKQTTKRKPISASKFYFFDVGIARFLQGRKTLSLKSPEFGEAFEHYIFHELTAYCSYNSLPPISYWRSTSQFEVDFIFNGFTAIEVKGKEVITPRDFRGLKALKEEGMMKSYLLVCLTQTDWKNDGIEVLGWKSFLEKLWKGEFTSVK
ncbi:MAG TPA: AAA family ATPase [Bacteriovoracaceae bacterium]|nr:AAA family ATPase [Bacteriovoracaceae bacterium]